MAKIAKPRELKPYKSYRFTAQDPAVSQVLTMIADKGDKMAVVARNSGVSTGTLYSWRKRKTRRPQNASIEAAGRSVGMKRVWVKMGKEG